MSIATTTITLPYPRAVQPCRRAYRLIERARVAYSKAGGREQPGDASDLHDINGTAVAILRNINGPVAAYCVHGTSLKRMSTGDTAAADLFAKSFDVPRDPRSAEYKAGALAALQFRLSSTPIPRPYTAGTAADAFYAGQAEGHAIWRLARSAAGAV